MDRASGSYSVNVTRRERISLMNRQLAELKAANRRREAQLRARKAHLDSAERVRERKLRTRCLTLMGSYMERVIKHDGAARARLTKKLDGFLTHDRDRDRALFDQRSKDGEGA